MYTVCHLVIYPIYHGVNVEGVGVWWGGGWDEVENDQAGGSDGHVNIMEATRHNLLRLNNGK